MAVFLLAVLVKMIGLYQFLLQCNTVATHTQHLCNVEIDIEIEYILSIYILK